MANGSTAPNPSRSPHFRPETAQSVASVVPPPVTVRKKQFSSKTLVTREDMLLALARQAFATDPPAFLREGKVGVVKLYEAVAQVRVR